MEKLGDVYIDLNQNETNIDDVNLNAIWVDLDKGFNLNFNLKISNQLSLYFKFKLKDYYQIILANNVNSLSS